MALELRPNCEYCDKDLAPDATDARICSYECTFCADCVERRLSNVCPNCGGGFMARPIRPAREWRSGVSRARQPASTKRVRLSHSREEIALFVREVATIPPERQDGDDENADSVAKELESYWDGVSDEELLATELTTDDPEALMGLVTVLPDGYEDSHVEYSYDLRGSGREEFVCVHGHHKHLCGFVMRKDDQRWLVGWMCGESIYGEQFDQHKADFNTAVNRRDRLRKRRDVEELARPLTQWLNETYASGVFDQYHDVRDQLKNKLRWVWR